MHFVKSIILTLAIALMGIVPTAAAAAIHCQGDCAAKNELCYSEYQRIKKPCCDTTLRCTAKGDFGYVAYCEAPKAVLAFEIQVEG
ncbi:hypothetical protein DFH09DRAFT_1309850 [Mycena vulgaris]|nr:hypothetical protein DFH09DRAFT_1309850 [Mycena vulgaris]